MSSPLAIIFTQNKLTGKNYVDWKRNLDIVLTAENHKMVLPNPVLLSRLRNRTRRLTRPGCDLMRLRDAIS